MQKPLLGAHVSVAGGLSLGIERATAMGAEVIQIFGASPRQWSAPLPSEEAVQKFKNARAQSNIKAVYLHAPYLNNLASTSDEMIEKSIANLSAHLKIAEMIGANGVVFHVGSGKEAPENEAMKKAINAMKIILKNTPGQAQLIIENAAGGGAKLGDSAKEVAALVHGVNSPRVKACFDTAHAFESGLIDDYSREKIKKLFDEWDKELGLEHLVALHANDSKTAFDSHHDRHENIGEGFIGIEAFRNLMQEKRIAHTHWMLEVPGFDGMGPDKKNLDILKSLR